MKTLSIIIILTSLFFVGCGSLPITPTPVPLPQRVIIEVQSASDSKVAVSDKDHVSRSMEVHNPEGQLSQLSFISNGKAFIKVFSGLSVADVTRLWNDLVILEETTTIRIVNLFINSPGGDAFSGLALADQIERAKRKGFKITAHASGIIASAAVPVFAVCNVRLAAPGTIFMVHEAALWKWPGRESASDIEAQGRLMRLLRDRYIDKLVNNSKLTKSQWEDMEKKTTWFSASDAESHGIVDSIE